MSTNNRITSNFGGGAIGIRAGSPIREEEKSFAHTYPINNRAGGRSTSVLRENTSSNAPNPVMTSSVTRGLREMAMRGGVFSSLDASHNRL